MTHSSEAACLLQTGMLYHRRLGLRPAEGAGEIVFAGFKRGAFSLYFGDAPIYHFDLEGRWQRAYIGETHFLKALDTTTVAIGKKRVGEGLVLYRHTLSFGMAIDINEEVRKAALSLMEGIQSGQLVPIEPPPGRSVPIAIDDLLALLQRIVKWSTPLWFAHHERYRATYAPTGFLPPEAQDALILQATVGPDDGLRFGPAATDEPDQARSEAEFDAHLRAVADLLGRRVEQCRRILLGGGGLLRLEASHVEAFLRATTRAFPVDPDAARTRASADPEGSPRLDGIVAYLGRLDPAPETAAWGRFRSLGLNRIVVGLGSEVAVPGDDPLRAIAAGAVDAGIALSLVVQADDHAAATADRLAGLPLRSGDLVYLVADSDDRRADLKARLAPALRPKGAKVVPYHPDKLWT